MSLHNLFHRSWIGVEVLIEAGFAPDKNAVEALLRKGDPVPLRVQQYLATSKNPRGRPKQLPVLTDWEQWRKAEKLVGTIGLLRQAGLSLPEACAAYGKNHAKSATTVDREYWRARATNRLCRPMFAAIIEELRANLQRLKHLAALQKESDQALRDLDREVAHTP
jgi:hypothetical protein